MEVVPPMFPFTASRRYSHILVGRQPHRMISALEHIFDLSLQNPLVTYLAGDPGSGKSHTVLNLERRSLLGEARHVVVIRADLFHPSAGSPLDQRSILAAVYQDPSLRERAASAGIDMTASDSGPMEGRMIDAINAVIGGISESAERKESKPFGLVIAVDGLDEYFRPSGEGLRGSDTETFVLNVRFLLDSLQRTCILLCLTSIIFEEAYRFVSQDRTFLRRFIAPQEYDGTRLDFKAFTETEASSLYGEYRDFWLHNVQGLDDRTRSTLREIGWPISREAVFLAREAAAGRPGPFQRILQSAFEMLRAKFPDAWLDPHSVVDLSLMAKVIALAARRAEAGIDVSNEELQRRLALLANWDERILELPRTIADSDLVSVLERLLAVSGFGVKNGARPNRLTVGQVHIREVTKGGRSGRLGLLIARDALPSDEDIRALNLLVATGTLHQLLILTRRADFDWVYSPRDHPVEFTRPNQRHLGNFSYVARLSPEHVASLALAGKNLATPDREATLRIVDSRCSPLPGYRLSDLLLSMAWNAILGGASE